MLKPEKIKISLEQIANGNQLLLVDIQPIKEFIDGKPTDKITSYRYSCVCPQNKFEKISIKVEEAQPCISTTDLAEKGTIKVTPLNFEGKFYKDRSGEYQFTAKADKIEVMK